MDTNELIKQIRELENFWEITPQEDMFGVGWNHAKDKIIELIQEMDKPNNNYKEEFVAGFQKSMDLPDQLSIRKSGY